MRATDNYVRQRLEAVGGMYKNVDAEDGGKFHDPIHTVREHAAELLKGKPTPEDLLMIGREIAAALPGDNGAAGLEAHWRAELERLSIPCYPSKRGEYVVV